MNALLKPRKADVSMLSDVFWHPYFNIFGELFLNDPDKSKVRVSFLKTFFEMPMLLLLGKKIRPSPSTNNDLITWKPVN